MDAIGKLPNGILEGDLNWLGGFSQCRGIEVPSMYNSTVPEILYRGQYCLAYVGNKSAPAVALVSIIIIIINYELI